MKYKPHITYAILFILIIVSAVFIPNLNKTTMSDNQFFSKPTMKLLESLEKDDKVEVTEALSAGANVNEVGEYGMTPIIYAVIKMKQPLVASLLELGADPNIRQNDGHNALTAAYELSSSNPELLATLIKSKKGDLNVIMPDDEPMIYYLAAGGKLDLLKLALENGADHSLRTGSNRLLVIEAALVQQYDAAQLLLDAGASPKATDAAGTTLLEFVKKGASGVIDPGGELDKSRVRLLERLKKLQ